MSDSGCADWVVSKCDFLVRLTKKRAILTKDVILMKQLVRNRGFLVSLTRYSQILTIPADDRPKMAGSQLQDLQNIVRMKMIADQRLNIIGIQRMIFVFECDNEVPAGKEARL